MQLYSAAVVVPVPEPARGAFHLLDQPVGAFGAGVRESGGAEHLDGGPPGLDRLGQVGQLGDVGIGAPAVERAQPLPDLVTVPATGSGGAERTELFLGDPRGEDLPARVVVDAALHIRASAACDSGSRPRGPSRRLAQAGSIVRPWRGEQVAGDTLTHGGDRLVPEHDQVEVVHRERESNPDLRITSA